MMSKLSDTMTAVRTDIGTVRTELSEKIEAGNKATRDLERRMDKNDKTFADRVAAVVVGLNGGPPDSVPTSSSAGQSSASNILNGASYASSVINGQSLSSAGGQSLSGQGRDRADQREDRYWRCRRSLRIWPVAG